MAAPVASTGASSLLAAARKQNVVRAEQRIQSGRAYTDRTLNTLQRAGVPFQSTLHQQVLEQHHQIQLQALRHALDIIKQHRAQTPRLAAPPRAHI